MKKDKYLWIKAIETDECGRVVHNSLNLYFLISVYTNILEQEGEIFYLYWKIILKDTISADRIVAFIMWQQWEEPNVYKSLCRDLSTHTNTNVSDRNVLILLLLLLLLIRNCFTILALSIKSRRSTKTLITSTPIKKL